MLANVNTTAVVSCAKCYSDIFMTSNTTINNFPSITIEILLMIYVPGISIDVQKHRWTISVLCNVHVCHATYDHFYDPLVLYVIWERWASLQWRHSGRDSVSNHQPHDCLLNRLFRRRSKKTSKLRVTGLCAGNSPHKWPLTRKMFPFDDVIMINTLIKAYNFLLFLKLKHDRSSSSWKCMVRPILEFLLVPGHKERCTKWWQFRHNY